VKAIITDFMRRADNQATAATAVAIGGIADKRRFWPATAMT
jgi:hypothetical protein